MALSPLPSRWPPCHTNALPLCPVRDGAGTAAGCLPSPWLWPHGCYVPAVTWVINATRCPAILPRWSRVGWALFGGAECWGDMGDRDPELAVGAAQSSWKHPDVSPCPDCVAAEGHRRAKPEPRVLPGFGCHPHGALGAIPMGRWVPSPQGTGCHPHEAMGATTVGP